MARSSSFVLVLALALSVSAAVSKKTAPGFQPGEYISEGGMGTLAIERRADGVLTFSIESIGANGHTCSLDGEIRNGKATLEGLEDEEPCVVTFTATAAGIDVTSSENGACRAYCGMRAAFEAVYFKPAPQCTAKAVNATRRKFQQLYDRKQWAEARAALEPLLARCEPAIDWITIGRIRNDLAVTFHKLRDFDACRAVLAPLAEDAALTDAEIEEKYPPTDAEMFLPIVRATRTNLKLCGARN
jgi:hypothetical protein